MTKDSNGSRPGHEWMKSFRELMKLQTNFLKYSGLWNIDPKYPIFLPIYFVYRVWVMSMMYIFSITLFADIYVNRNNLSITTDDGCIFAGMCVVIFKAMNYQFHHKEIAQLINEVLKCGDDLCDFSEIQDVKKLLQRYEIRNRVIFYGFCVLGGFLGIALLFFSPVQDGLPIRAKYPFDTTISPWHEIAFAVEASAVSTGLIGIVGMDSLMVLLCSLLTALFTVLSLNFEDCSKETNQMDQTFEEHDKDTVQSVSRNRNDRFSYRYKRCLRFHQRLVSMTNSYNRIYNHSMFVQLLSSTSIICLTCFQAVVVGGQSTDIMKFGIYLSAAVSQLLYNCWIGNELSYACSVLDRSEWLSGWHHERLTDIAQMFTLSVMFSRQPITLKAGIFYVLSLETFIAIIRRSYSVFTLLNNMHTTIP